MYQGGTNFYKIINIPEDVSVGAVIGREGRVIKSLQKEYNCSIRVDAGTHSVHISSTSLQRIKPLEDNLVDMFKSFSLNSKSTYSHSKFNFCFLKNSADKEWKFVEIKIPSSIQHSKKHTYILKEADTSTKVMNNLNGSSWICNLDDVMIQACISKIKNIAFPIDTRVKASLGYYSYKLIAVKPQQSYSWEALNNMQIGSHFKCSWVGDFDYKKYKIFSSLYESLMSSFSIASWQNVVKVHVTDSLRNASYTLKYKFENHKAFIKRAYDHRELYAQIAFILEEQVGYRIRIFRRNPDSEAARTMAKNYITVSSSGGELNANAPASLKIEHSECYEKTHVCYNGLRFTVYRLSDGRMRLEARLEEKSLSSKTTEAQELIEKLELNLRLESNNDDSRISCRICMEYINQDDSSIFCSKGHHLCEVCFVMYLDSELSKMIGQLQETQCNIKCPVDGCCYLYTKVQIAKGGNAVMDKYCMAMRKIGEIEAIRSLPLQDCSDIRREIENALNICCPHCFTVFIDYDACDAVQCGSCREYFCGLCIEACLNSADAHLHAANCKYKNSNDVFSSVHEINKAHWKLKADRLKKILEKLNPSELKNVLKECSNLLTDFPNLT